MKAEYIYIAAAVVTLFVLMVISAKKSPYSGPPIPIEIFQTTPTPIPIPFPTPKPPPTTPQTTPIPIPFPTPPKTPTPISQCPPLPTIPNSSSVMDAIIYIDQLLFMAFNGSKDQQIATCSQIYYDHIKKFFSPRLPEDFFGFKLPNYEAPETYALLIFGLYNITRQNYRTIRQTPVQRAIVALFCYMLNVKPPNCTTYNTLVNDLQSNLRSFISSKLITQKEYYDLFSSVIPDKMLCMEILKKLLIAGKYPL